MLMKCLHFISVIRIRLRSEQSTIIASHGEKTHGKWWQLQIQIPQLAPFFSILCKLVAPASRRVDVTCSTYHFQMRIPKTPRDSSQNSALPRSSKALSHVGVRLSSSATAPQAPASRPARRNGLSASGSPWGRLAIKFETI